MTLPLNECLPARPIALLLALALAGCATPSGSGPADAGLPMAAPGAPSAPLVPGPRAEAFVGESVRRLEAQIGAPALIRQEGENEFRRYDLPKCRAFAVVMPAGGRVVSLETGALVRGEAAPSFSQCTARAAGPGV